MPTNTEESQISPDLHVIVIKQNLDHWNIPDIIHMIKRIEDVWLFDKNQVTHMCELMPSYILHPIETRAILHDEFNTETNREDVDEVIMTNKTTETEAYLCPVIERMLESGNHDFKRLPHTKGPDETYDEFFEGVVEYCQCNSQL